MKRIFLLFPLVLLAAPAISQRARIDSLQRVLMIQPKADVVRMNTLIALAKSCATYQPKRGIDYAHEAWQIADRMKDDCARSRAWNAERWCLNYIGMIVIHAFDSISNLAETAARRCGNRHLLAEAMVGRPMREGLGDFDWSDETGIARMRQRNDTCFDLFREAGDYAGLMEAYAFVGNIPQLYDASLIDSALAYCEQVRDTSGICYCLTNRMWVEPHASDRQEMIRDQLRVVELARLHGNNYTAGNAHVTLCWFLSEAGRYLEALKHGQQAIAIYEEMGLEEEIGPTAHYNMGDIYRDMNDLALAKVHYRKGMRDPWIGNSIGSENALAEVCLRLGQTDSAMHYLTDALMRNPSQPPEQRAVETRGWLAKVYSVHGDTLRSLAIYDTLVTSARENSFSYMELIKYSRELGGLYASASPALLRRIGLDRERARSKTIVLFTESLGKAREFGMVREQSQALLALSNTYERMGEVAKALDFHQQYTTMKDSVLSADKAKAVANLQIQYETEKKEQQIVLLGKDKEVQAKEIEKQKLVRNGFVGGFAFVGAFALIFFVQRNRISKARKRSDELLLNILPEEVADELKVKGEAEAKHFNSATILFTDFKGFTQLSEKVTPVELVAELNACFKAFDGIMGAYRIEKIKTIGDAYMAAGGLPDPQHGSPAVVIRAALEMQEFMKRHKAEREAAGKPYFEMRVGIHTGPVVAGIVGVKKFQYDIWGDTVNTASRMESSGEVGEVNISEATFALVREQAGSLFHFTPRGKVQAKGKGEMEMYFVHRSVA